MSSAASPTLDVGQSLSAPQGRASLDEAQLREALRRCPPATLEAALRFHRSGDPACLPVIVRGVIGRYVGREHRAKLDDAPDSLRLIEDLGVDSLTLLEIVLLAEEVLPVSLGNDDLRHLRTLGDVQAFIVRQLSASPEN